MISKEISKAIKSRTSTYPNEFNGEIIEKKYIMELLENANYAPTHKMTQPWRFKIFFDNAKIKLLEAVIKINTDLSKSKRKNLEEKFEKSSHIICICLKKNNDILPEWEEIAATAMAVQNLWISCVGSDIGGYWSSPKYINKLNTFLSLNQNEKCLGLFYLGILKTREKRNKKRDSIHKKIQWFNE